MSLSNPAAVQPTFEAPVVKPEGASLTFELTVTDEGGLQATDTCIVNISAFNLSPAADAGEDQTVSEGVTVMLDGSGSSDPDDGIASYRWIQTAGPQVTLSDPAAVQPTFIPEVGPEGASFTFQLTVTDNSGLQATDNCVVTVSWTNAEPIADAGPDQTVNEEATVTLDGSNSSDPDDNIVSYLWVQTDGPEVTLSDPSAVQPAFDAPLVKPEGASLTFELTVTDNGGLHATDTCIVNVSAFNLSPTADAGADQTVGEGVTVILNGSESSDPDDGIASYQWIQTAGPEVTLSDPGAVQPEFTPDVGPEGASLTFQLTVTDNGLQAADTCIVNVSWINVPPVADAGEDQSVKEDISVIALDGSGSLDPDNGIYGYLWTQLSGSPVTLSDPAISQPTFTPPDVGPEAASLTLQLTVTDENGLQSADTCIVDVLWVQLPPIADAGENQTVSEGVEVMLDGSGSSDPDDGIKTYEWLQIAGMQVISIKLRS